MKKQFNKMTAFELVQARHKIKSQLSDGGNSKKMKKVFHSNLHAIDEAFKRLING